MRNKKYSSTAMVLFAGFILVSTALTGCGSKNDEQRFAYPLCTASPEDTVTQLYADKFVEEVDRLSIG